MHRRFATAAPLLFAPLALAGGPTVHFDALLMIDPDGALVTGLVDFDAQTTLAQEQRVYDATFQVFDVGGGVEVATTDVPGFNALLPSNPSLPVGYQTLPPNTPVSFDALAFEIAGATANLFYWDGNGAVDFQPSSVVTNVSKAPSVLFSVDIDGGAGDVPGFVIRDTNASGGVHQHVDFRINNSHLAGDGLYLWSFKMTVGELEAEPVYFVHALGAAGSAAQDAAALWVQQNLVDEQPLCVADFDGNGQVDLTDFGVFGAEFGNGLAGGGPACDATNPCQADFDGNGVVDLTDFGVFGAEFGNGLPGGGPACSP